MPSVEEESPRHADARESHLYAPRAPRLSTPVRRPTVAPLTAAPDLLPDAPSTPLAAGPAGVAARLASSPQLRQRRFQLLPLRGPDAVFTEAQGRTPADTTTSATALADLISSIASVGVLQPILVEEHPATAGATPSRLLVAGERRLRAARWGAVHLPDNPNFAAIPAVVCPGPLAEADRRVWQLVENLAREDLQPGELGAALLFERCAVLVPKLLAAGRDIPAQVFTLDDPVQRWHALDKIRGTDATVGAPWEEVLRRLGLQVSERKARQLHQALAALPAEVSTDMDQARISLATRLRLAALERGRATAGMEIWEAVRAAGRPDLLPGALAQRQTHPDLDTASAIEAADAVRAAGNAARAAALTRPSPAPPTVPVAPPAAAQDGFGEAHDTETPRAAAQHDPTEPSDAPSTPTAPAPSRHVDASPVRRALTDLLGQLRAGAQPSRFDAGSLRLLAADLLALLDQPSPEPTRRG